MKNNETKKVGIGVDGHKQTKFNFSHDVNTTMAWGDCEPLMCELMLPNSKLKVKAKNLTRLAPLVAPCFGRIAYKTLSMFVPMHEIYPAFEAMMTGQSIKGPNAASSIPFSVPNIQANMLAALCCIGADCSIWIGEDSTSSASMIAPSSIGSIDRWVQRPTSDGGAGKALSDYITAIGNFNLASGTSPWFDVSTGLFNLNFLLGHQGSSSAVAVPRSFSLFDDSSVFTNKSINPDNADLVCIRRGVTNFPGLTYAICFRFSDYGKRYAKLFRGLGYNLDLSDSSRVSLLPLFAYYRVYWEAYGVRRYQNFESTALFQMINTSRYGMQTGYTSNISSWTNTSSVLWEFLRDLGQMWYTDAPDYVSAHQLTPTEGAGAGSGGASAFTNILNTGFIDIGVSNRFGNGDSSGFDGSPFINQVQHGELDSQLLKIAYKWTNRQTILGGDIEKQLKAMGEGQYVDDCRISFIGATSKDIPIQDCSATADTFQAATDTTSASGKVLGEYAGKAVQYDEGKSLEWSTDKYGYWITMAMIVPEGGYCQQVDRKNYAVDRWGMYQPEFDGLGYQPTTAKEIVGSPVASFAGSDIPSGFMGSSGDTFGYIPRCSEWKISRNVINGDFALNSTRDNMSPYHLDKLIEVGSSVSGDETTSSGTTIRKVLRPFFDYSLLPKAGNSWRYGSRYPWLAQFSRIFANMGDNALPLIGFIQGLGGESAQYNGNMYQRTDENFICHNVLLVDYYAPMKPIALSYQTFDEEKGANGAEVKA